MRAEDPRPIQLKDYAPPVFLVDDVKLDIELDPLATRVRATMTMRRNPAAQSASASLVLDGQKLKLLDVKLNGETLSANAYQADAESLRVHDLPDGTFTFETLTTCGPEANTQLLGLYLSNDIYCTQCEAEGFRRITYYPDRPDVMAVFTTRIVADEKVASVLLSNGNLRASGPAASTLPNGMTPIPSLLISSRLLRVIWRKSKTNSSRRRAVK